MSNVGTPTITEYCRGIPLTLEELESAIWTLSAALEEQDYDGVDQLIKRAKDCLTNGSDAMPSLLLSLTSHELTGSYSAGRDELNREYRSRNYGHRRFEHNPSMGPISRVLERATITIGEIGDGLYMMSVADRKNPVHKDLYWFEDMIAKALEIERALVSISLSFPLEVVGGDHYRFDFAPFINALNELGAGPIQYSGSTEMTGLVAVSQFMKFMQNIGEGSTAYPSLCISTPVDLDFEINLGTFGCNFAHRKVWEDYPTMDCQVDGTIFTGTLAEGYEGDGSLQEPSLYISLRRSNVAVDGAPVLPPMTTPELKAPMREFAAGISGILARA